MARNLRYSFNGWNLKKGNLSPFGHLSKTLCTVSKCNLSKSNHASFFLLMILGNDTTVGGNWESTCHVTNPPARKTRGWMSNAMIWLTVGSIAQSSHWNWYHRQCDYDM